MKELVVVVVVIIIGELEASLYAQGLDNTGEPQPQCGLTKHGI